VLTQNQLATLLAVRRQQRNAVALRDALFPRQREVLAALGAGERRIAVRCSRRSGKSYMSNSLLAAKSEERPHALCLYLALTHDNVRRIAWPSIKALNGRFDLGLKLNEAFLRAAFRNGSQIEYSGIGASATGEVADRFRGAADGYDLIVIDEASKFRPEVLEYLITEVLWPSLMDKRGALILTGTPTPNASGIFYQATSSGLPGWRPFFWTTGDNPYMRQQWEEEIAEQRRLNPKIDESAAFRREYFGEWAVDASDLVYELDEAINCLDLKPADDAQWSGHCIGVDVGWSDATAFCAVGWQRNCGDLWVLESHKEPRMAPDAIADKIRSLQARWPRANVVIDSAGGSTATRSILEELATRYQVSANPAEKTDKATWIAQVNTDFRRARIHIVRHANRQLLAELHRVPWRAKADARYREEDPAFPNDLCDAFLYAYRYARHYLERGAKIEKSEEDRMRDKFRELQRKRWWR
jgi:hypothetical protein